MSGKVPDAGAGRKEELPKAGLTDARTQGWARGNWHFLPGWTSGPTVSHVGRGAQEGLAQEGLAQGPLSWAPARMSKGTGHFFLASWRECCP